MKNPKIRHMFLCAGSLVVLITILLSPAFNFFTLRKRAQVLERKYESLKSINQKKDNYHENFLNEFNIDEFQRKSESEKLVFKQTSTDSFPDSKLIDGAAGIVELDRVPTKSDLGTKKFRKLIAKIQKRQVAWAIYIQSGNYTIPSLSDFLENDDAIIRIEGNYHLKCPLIIGPEASLTIDGEEFNKLYLENDGASFIHNFGNLLIRNAKISSWNSVKKSPEVKVSINSEFRPFISAWSGSKSFIDNSEFQYLGYPGKFTSGMTFASTKKKYLLASLKQLKFFAKRQSIKTMMEAPKVKIKNSRIYNFWNGIQFYGIEDGVLYRNFINESSENGIVIKDASEIFERTQKDILNFISKNRISKSGLMGLKYLSNSNIILSKNVFEENGDNGATLRETEQKNNPKKNTSAHLIFENLFLKNKGNGLYIKNYYDFQLLKNVSKENSRSGLLILNAKTSKVTENYLENNQSSGGTLVNTKELILTQNYIVKNFHYGLSIRKAQNNLIQNNKVSDNSFSGILLRDVSNVKINLNNIENNKKNGLSLINVTEGEFISNLIKKNKQSGIFIKDASLMATQQNKIVENKAHGIFLTQIHQTKVRRSPFIVKTKMRKAESTSPFNLSMSRDYLASNSISNLRLDYFKEVRLHALEGEPIQSRYFGNKLGWQWREIREGLDKQDREIQILQLENW